jgi:hypothetical protein
LKNWLIGMKFIKIYESHSGFQFFVPSPQPSPRGRGRSYSLSLWERVRVRAFK